MKEDITINKAKIAKELEITTKTIYNWEKNRPKLFNFIINCYKNKNINVNITKEEKELIEAFRELNEEEQKLYLYEIKARALRKKIG